MTKKIYQLKVVLDAESPIWRRLYIRRTSTFWDLHVVLRDSFDWSGSHFHVFEIIKTSDYNKGDYGKTQNIVSWLENEPGEKISWKCKIRKYLEDEDYVVKYIYDLGECHEHTITLEKIHTVGSLCPVPCVIQGKGIPVEDGDDSEEEEPIITKFIAKKVEFADPQDELIYHKQRNGYV
jgi:hypothetical protein